MITKIVQRVLILLPCLLFCNGFKIQNENDDGFRLYLDNAMANYSTWLKTNNFDPSPLITDTLILDADTFRTAYLVCEISDQFVSGHSETTNDEKITPSSFATHSFGIGRIVQQPYKFQGSFNCTGAIKEMYHNEINRRDIPFSGKGTFSVTTKNSTEIVVLSNVGITEEYKFDLSQSWTTSIFTKVLEKTELVGQWNDSRISSTYLEDVVETFQDVYDLQFYFKSNDIFNPNNKLLHQYLRQIMQDAELESILPPDNLPSPYSPTPITTTTPAATSPSTVNSTVSTHHTTSPPPISSTPNVGIMVNPRPNFIFVQVILFSLARLIPNL